MHVELRLLAVLASIMLTSCVALLLCTVAYLILESIDVESASVGTHQRAAGVVGFAAVYFGTLSMLTLLATGVVRVVRTRHRLPATARRP